MSTDKQLWDRALKLEREVRDLRQDARVSGERQLADVFKRVERELAHNSFTDHAAPRR